MRSAIRLLRLTALSVALGAPTALLAAAPAGAYAGRPFGDAAHRAEPQRIPGPVFCAYYDTGGEGIAYHDIDAGNEGSGKLNPADGPYLDEFRRGEDVDISYTKPLNDLESPCNRVTPPPGLLYVGWTWPGEWFRLTVAAEEPGTYVADLLYTSKLGGALSLDVNGRPAGFLLTVESTFDPRETIPWRQWHHWAVARDAFTVDLPRGVSVLTVHIVSAGNMNLATLAFRRPGTERAGPVITAATTPSPAGPAWRPFSADSPWNQRIAPDAASDPDSAALIADLAARGPLYVNLKDWSIPVYFVDAERTPKRDVGDSRPGVYGAGFEFPRQIPIPDDAVASPPVGPDSDNHLCIIDRDRHREWGLWAARRDAAGRWFTGLGAVTDLAGTGVAPPWFAAPRELDSHRARASGFPLIAGLIRRDDIQAGRIDHALVFAYDHCRSAFFIPPASTAQVTRPEITNAHGIPMGGRIQLDPAWDVEHSGLSAAGQIIARALQEYGAYCGDFAGANVLYAENSPAAVRAWAGVLGSEDLAAVFTPEMIRRHFRVIALGNILPGQNLEVPPPYVLAFAVDGETAPARIDQLTRTITVRPPAAGRTRARWTLHPHGTRLAASGQGSADDTGELDLSQPAPLTLTAPDGRTNTWTIVVGR